LVRVPNDERGAFEAGEPRIANGSSDARPFLRAAKIATSEHQLVDTERRVIVRNAVFIEQRSAPLLGRNDVEIDRKSDRWRMRKLVIFYTQ